MQTSGASRREIAESRLNESAVIARSKATKQSSLFVAAVSGLLRWSLSSGAHSRDPLARNDVEKASAHLPSSPVIGLEGKTRWRGMTSEA